MPSPRTRSAGNPALNADMRGNRRVPSGCIVSGATVRRSILFTKVRIGERSLIEYSVLLGGVVIGSGVTLRGVIVDESCVIPDGFKAGVHPAEDRANFHFTERGVALIPPRCWASRFIVSVELEAGPSARPGSQFPGLKP